MSSRSSETEVRSTGATKKTATLSACGRYRYTLERRWDDGPAVLFVMLNPSTADAEVDDPTIRRCIGFARSWGYGTLLVGNLFAYRATQPRELRACGGYQAMAGPDNETWLDRLRQRASIHVAAWGANSDAELIGRHFAEHWPGWWALGTTASGAPRHPLYVRGDTQLERWPPTANHQVQAA